MAFHVKYDGNQGKIGSGEDIFAVQTRLEKMQVPKSVRKARSSPENERENELITRKTKLS